MCSISGSILLNGTNNISAEDVVTMIGAQSHRGMDGGGVYASPNSGVILGHGRLSIIDLTSSADQPFFSDNKDIVLVFNGEIYNYIEIKEELILKGVSFKTSSDTEVLLKAYMYWGESFVNRLNGMWAFCIYDSVRQKVILSRDRFGVKPLNYIIVNGMLIFSSEIKGIKSLGKYFSLSPDYKSISNFLANSVGAQSKHTWFDQVKRVPPATSFVIQAGNIQEKSYWTYPMPGSPKEIAESNEGLKGLLSDAISIRFRSDVPVGITLSGGLDSSIISYCRSNMKSINGYVAHFDQRYTSELPYAQKVADQTNIDLRAILITSDVMERDLENMVYHLESANTSLATLSVYNLMKEASSDGVKVMLEGQGADEIFAGYYFYAERLILDYLKAGKLSLAAEEITKNKNQYGNGFILSLLRTAFPLLREPYRRIRNERSLLTNDMVNLTSTWESPPNRGEDYFRFRHKNELVNLLHYGDALSMSSTVESRLPFMDYRLVEKAFNIPLRHHYEKGINKALLKRLVKNRVPAEIIERKKVGFCNPLGDWLREDQGRYLKNILLDSEIIKMGLVNRKPMEKLINLHLSNSRDYSHTLFKLMQTEIWFEKFG